MSTGGGDIRGLQEEKEDTKPIEPCRRPRNSVSVAQARVMSLSYKLYSVIPCENTATVCSTCDPPYNLWSYKEVVHVT